LNLVYFDFIPVAMKPVVLRHDVKRGRYAVCRH